MARIVTYGIGGFDETKPNNNIISDVESKDDSLTDDVLLHLMRSERDELLKQSDWTQVADSPVDKDAWADYRQKLRDFPATWIPSEIINFPNPPA